MFEDNPHKATLLKQGGAWYRCVLFTQAGNLIVFTEDKSTVTGSALLVHGYSADDLLCEFCKKGLADKSFRFFEILEIMEYFRPSMVPYILAQSSAKDIFIKSGQSELFRKFEIDRHQKTCEAFQNAQKH